MMTQPTANPAPQPLRYGSVCSGIEAVSLAWQPLGMQPAWFSEIDPFPCAVLAHRHPTVPNLGDMSGLARNIRGGTVEAPDILVGGTPCQSFSVAGARKGLDDPRGALTLCYVELANAIDQTRLETRRPASVLVWENVPGVLSDRNNAFGCLLGALAGEDRPLEPPGSKWTYAGCIAGPRRRIAWRVLDAQYFGLAQRRRRVFLIASSRDDLDPASVLFERQGLLGNSSPRFSPWQEDAVVSGAHVAAAGGYTVNQPYGPVRTTICFGGGNTSGPIDVAACMTARVGTKGDFETDTLIVQPQSSSICHARGTASSSKESREDVPGWGLPMAFGENSRGELRWASGHGQLAGALSSGGGKPGQGRPMVLSVTLQGRSRRGTAELGDEVPPTLRASSGGNDKAHALSSEYAAHFQVSRAGPAEHAWSQWRVRRLMPVECERLQGMPDNWTLVPYRGKPAADTPRYKAIGNSMAVPCVAWLGHRLLINLHASG
ncbi:DNA cytosine methyltransferase [Pseudomonas aeruginosa]|uniref:DNA cytosine methyltransferase n=1 Tax=Pseudomonas aeruginosa TaxID=287 RepID=UPI00163AEE80|nr:DNA cytosine methyltransferase [Pseudomonas aeruginosa]MBK1492673.1 DNA cytosine methyltransferase [Pseudomonas aeruginosa]